MNPILKTLLKFCTTKNLFKDFTLSRQAFIKHSLSLPFNYKAAPFEGWDRGMVHCDPEDGEPISKVLFSTGNFPEFPKLLFYNTGIEFLNLHR